MYGKLYKNIGLSLIIFAFFFLFEPNCGIIDPLPDFIGYTILCFALINLADINDKISNAFRIFRIGILLGVCKIIVVIILNVFFSSEEQLLASVVCVFVFAVSDIIVMITGFKSLFEGLLTLGIFEDGEAVYRKKRENGKNATEKLYFCTVFFAIYKSLICALPEFTTLRDNSSYEFFHVLRWMAIGFVLPVSIFWLIKAVSYFISVKKDEPFIKALSDKYLNHAESNPEFYLCRVLFFGLGGVMAALVLLFNVYSENVNYIPNAFFFVLIIAFVFFLREHTNKWKYALISAIPGTIFSLLLFIVEKRFFERHNIGAIKRNYEAYQLYYVMLTLYCIVALITVTTLILVTLAIKDIFTNYGRIEVNNNDNSMGFNVRAIVFVLFGIIAQIGNVFYVISLPYFEKSPFFTYSGTISFILSVAFVASAFVLYFFVTGEIRYKHKKYLL